MMDTLLEAWTKVYLTSLAELYHNLCIQHQDLRCEFVVFRNFITHKSEFVPLDVGRNK